MPSREITFYNETDTELEVQAKVRGVVKASESIAAGGHGSVSVKGSKWCPTVSVLQGNTPVLSIGNSELSSSRTITIFSDFSYSAT